jgi:hypothetical protein
MLLQVASETRRLSVVSAGGTTPALRGVLPPNDPFVRELTGATVNIMVRVGDSQPLVMPPSPLIATYAQQCAAGEVRGAPVPAGNNVEPSGSVNVVAGNAATANAQ